MELIKKSVALGSAGLAAIYLANFGAGVIDIIPDNIPVAGNLDEFVASLILIRSLACLGWKSSAAAAANNSAFNQRPKDPSAEA